MKNFILRAFYILAAILASVPASVANPTGAPTITSALPDKTYYAEGVVATESAISFTIADPDTANGSFTNNAWTGARITATSDNPNLILPANAATAIGGSSGNRNVTIKHEANITGSANVTVTISDGTNQNTYTFRVTVVPRPNYYWSILAGSTNGTSGSANGTGTEASFNAPTGMVRDSQGNLFVSDVTNQLIRKITPAGVVTAFAGTQGTAGFADGTGTAARFSSPSQIAIDASENLYVADGGNNRIRKITPAGVVTTFAGMGTASSLDGAALSATFNEPTGIAISSTGVLYVSENTGKVIRKIENGQVSTVAGLAATAALTNGFGTAARFQAPNSILMLPNGNLLIRDVTSAAFRLLNTVTTEVTTLTTGATGFNSYASVDAQGNLYLPLAANQLTLTSDFDSANLVGSGTAGSALGVNTAATISDPRSMVFAPDGTVYLVSRGQNNIRVGTPYPSLRNPGTQSINEATRLAFSSTSLQQLGAFSNALNTAGTATLPITMQLSVQSGTLDFNNVAAPSGVTVTGVGTSSVTLTGDETAVNTYLANFGYTPNAGYINANANGGSLASGAVSPDVLSMRMSTANNLAAPITGSLNLLVRAADNKPRIVSALPDKTYYADTTVATEAPITLTVGDPDTANTSFVNNASTGGRITATSDNPNLILPADIYTAIGGTGSARTLTIKHQANITGSANVTVTINDGTNQNTYTFKVTVAPTPMLAVEQPAGTALAIGGNASFGNRTIGQSADLTFTLRSQGELTLLMSSGVDISGAAASDFSLVGSVPASLPAGGNGTLTVRFTPTTSGNRSATLSIPTNDMRPGRSPYTITLTGNGSATPTIATYANATSQVLGGWVNGGNFTIGGVAGSFSANTTKWISSETPNKVVDANTDSKFLIYRNSNAGVILKPTNSSLVFNRLALSTANDASERDPASFILYGSSSNLTGSEGTNIPISSLTPIASGNVTMLDARKAGPTVIQFANSVAYTSYVVVFPTVRNPATATGSQVSEIQLSQGATPPLAVAMADARGGQLSGSNFSFGSIGNSNPGTNWLAGESPDHAVDGNVNTKFAIFRSSGAGLLASPQAGPARMNILTLWTADDAPERDPATYQVYGFPTRITQTSGTLALGNGTLLANGTVTLPAGRNSGPVQVDFDNGTAYSSYLVVFPTVKNSSSTNLTQISEVQFSYNGTITPSAGLIGNFTASAGSASASQSFTVNGRGLSGPVTLTAPTGFEISTDNSTFSSSLQVNNPGGTIQSVYRGAFGNYTTASDNIWSAGSGVEFPNQYAFAAITSNGSVVTWGFDTFGGNSTNVAGNLTSNVKAVYSNGGAFAALKTDGSVVTWGNATFGGNSTNVAGNLTSNVTAVYSTIAAFAALKTDGSVVTWGAAGSGGNSTIFNSFPQSYTSVAAQLTSNVTAVYSNPQAFAALKNDGSVVTWGDAGFGGNSTSVAGNLSSNVTAVYSNPQAFAALKTNGSVVTWGDAVKGGNSTNVSGGNLSSNVTAVYSNSYAFAALKANGSVVTWGFADWGGNSTKVTGGNLTSNVTAVYSTPAAFAALKANGSVVTWGDAAFGGNSTSVAGNLTSNVKAVYSTQQAFAALKTDGSVVTWGDAASGGNSTSVAGNLTSNVTAVYSTRFAFAALKTDGSVVTWGNADLGGNSTSVSGNLSSNVTAVYSTPAAFAALKTDGSVVTWGDVRFGASGGPANIGAGFPIPATIYTRLSSTAPAGSVSGNLTLTSSGVGNQTVALSGTVSSVSAPTIAASPASLGNFTTTFGSASASQSFTVNGTALTANISVTAPSGFQISSDNATFSSSLSLTRTGGNVTAANVYARIASSASVGPVSGNITLASPGAEPKSVTLSGIVGSAATPSISVTPVALTGFTASFGSASAAQSFTVNGSGLSGPVNIIAPTGFEISTDNSTFSSSLRVNNAGTIQTVYRGAFGDYTTASGKIWTAGSGGEFPNTLAFAALKADGSVVTWGSGSGGDSRSVSGNLSSNVTALYSNDSAFAALKADGSLVTWGVGNNGGDSTSVSGNLSSNVKAVYSTKYAFAALKTDGSVVTWGNANNGGNSTAVSGSLSSNVTGVYSNQLAFAALKDNGSVVTWGNADSGGNSSSVAGTLSSNVTAVYSNAFAFAALTSNGSVVTWGSANNGGNSTAVSGNLSSNVTAVHSNSFAFAALKANGSVVTWGFAAMGGNSTAVAGNLSSNVTAVYSTSRAFAALKTDGSVVTWGDAAFGGNSSSVAGNLSSNVTAVYSTESAFAALKTDGSVVTWGDAANGGNSSSVAGNLSSNVTAVYSTQYAFAALKTDGSVVTWGDAAYGGNSSSVSGNLSSNVKAVYSTAVAFAALKSDGSVVTWGNSQYGASGGPANIGAGFPIPATIYTRLSSTTPAGSVSGNLTLTSSGVGNQTVALSGTVSSVSAPTIAASPASLGNFTTTFGSASASQSFTVNGTALTANISVTAPSGFQISSDNATFSSSLSLTRTGGNVTAANVYARIASSASVGPVSGNITLASPGAEPKSVTLSGIVGSAATPSISVTPVALTGFTASFGSASAAQSFTVNGSNLTANLTVGAPAGFEVSSTVGGVFSANLSLAPVSGTVAPTSLYTRLAATAQAGANSGNLTLASTGATSRQVALSGTATLPYEDWVAYWTTQNGSFSGATALGTADSDSDGYNNTTEFAFGGNPLAPAASIITVAPAGGNITVTFLARVGNGTTWTGGNATGNGLNYQIQSTANLMLGFQSANVTVGLDSNQSGIPSADIPYQRWKFQAPISGQMKFYRVKAGNATTEPVGFLTMNITAGTGSAKRLSLISAPLLDTASINGSVAGRLTGVTSANLTCSSANWTAGALSQAATPYLIQMTSGNATGHMLLISTTVNNTASTVTINSDDVAAANGNIASLGIAVGDSFKIIPCDTLSSFLGTPATTAVLGNGTAANADTVILTTNGVSQGYYYSSNLTRWTRDAAGLADSSNVPIRPDAGIQYSRLRNIPLSLTVIGKAPTMARKAPVKNSGVTCLATFFPHNATLASLGLQNLSNWTTGPSAAVADTVTILSNGISSTYYHNGTNWVKNAFGNPISNSVVIPAGASLLINQRGSDPQTSIFSQPLPYSF